MDDEFFVDDEPLEVLLAAFDAGEKMVTAPPADTGNPVALVTWGSARESFDR